MQDDWQEQMSQLTEQDFADLIRHMAVYPLPLRGQSWLTRVVMSPVWIWKHFLISWRGGSKWWFAVGMAWKLNYTAMFWVKRICLNEAK